ncbi:protein FAM177A1 [Centroberyx gerrardi]
MSDSHQEGEDIKETEFGGAALSKQRRVIHFSSGETLEEEEEEEEDSEEEEVDSSNGQAFREPAAKARFSFKNVAVLVGRMSLRTCDFLGEKLAGLLGLNAAKYQYAIDQHQRDHKTTGSQGAGEGLSEGGTERIHLSPRLDRSQYGATAALRSPADPQYRTHDEDRNEGSHNRGYQEDDDHLK